MHHIVKVCALTVAMCQLSLAAKCADETSLLQVGQTVSSGSQRMEEKPLDEKDALEAKRAALAKLTPKVGVAPISLLATSSSTKETSSQMPYYDQRPLGFQEAPLGEAPVEFQSMGSQGSPPSSEFVDDGSRDPFWQYHRRRGMPYGYAWGTSGLGYGMGSSYPPAYTPGFGPGYEDPYARWTSACMSKCSVMTATARAFCLRRCQRLTVAGRLRQSNIGAAAGIHARNVGIAERIHAGNVAAAAQAAWYR